MRIRICDFTKRELYQLRRLCNFTPDEMTLFNLRSRDIPLEQCADEMACSIETVNRIAKRINNKVERVCGIKPKRIDRNLTEN